MQENGLSEQAKFARFVTRVTIACGVIVSATGAVATVHAAKEVFSNLSQPYTCPDLMAPPQGNKPAGPGYNRSYNGDPIYCVTDNQTGDASLTHGELPPGTTRYTP